MKSRVVESIVIGTLAGGWASRTYWQGSAGVFIGIVVGLIAIFFLTIQREEESKTIKRKSASPYKRKCLN